ncbi:MAG: bacteriohemerythrin [Treponema sp.]|nr:bacteriohemerythrin [Treponema sp.]
MKRKLSLRTRIVIFYAVFMAATGTVMTIFSFRKSLDAAALVLAATGGVMPESFRVLIRGQVLQQALLALACTLAGVVIMLIVTRMIFGRLGGIRDILEKIAKGEGDLSQRIPIQRYDEIGTLAASFNQTMDAIRGMVMAMKRQTEALADLGNRLALNMEKAAVAVQQIRTSIVNIKEQSVNQSSSVTQTNTTMNEVSSHIEKLNGHVERQAGNIVQSSGAIEQMIANIQSATETLVRNAENVGRLTAASETGREGLQKVSQDMQEIQKESQGLLEINAVMENIASQTSLLSMNAAIEAAHAGDSGRGFAVVADEIRKLAASSGAQSKTIGSVLKKIKESIDGVHHAIGDVFDNFQAIDSEVRVVSGQETAIRNAMEEQSTGSRQILEAIASLQEITREVRRGADEMFQGSGKVIGEGRQLELLTRGIAGGVSEIAAGADSINAAIEQVTAMSLETRKSIGALAVEMTKFKVEIQNAEYLWDNRYLIGVEEIDSQHKELFKAINGIVRACNNGLEKDELKKSIEFLNNYTVKHFFEEEQIQKRSGYPEFDKHHLIHENFKEKVRALAKKWTQGNDPDQLVREVRAEVGDWLIAHITVMDTRLGAYLKDRGREKGNGA